MGIYDEIAKQCQSAVTSCRYCVRLDMLLDNAGDDSHGDAVLFIQMCYGKAHVVFSRGPAPVITGMRNGVGSVGKTDMNQSFPAGSD